MDPVTIANRCERVGLARKQLAELAKLDETTVERTLNLKTKPYWETVAKLQTALQTREIEVLRHLVALHPQEAMAALCPEGPAAHAEVTP